MLKATIQLTGISNVKEELAAIKQKLSDLSEPLQEAGEFLMEFFSNDVYQSEGSAYGAPWAPLNPDYEARKIAKYGATPILIASGRMSRSYDLKVASDYLLISNTAKTARGDWLAAFHQEGTDKMPQRQVMKFQDEQLNHVTDIIVKHINRVLNSKL